MLLLDREQARVADRRPQYPERVVAVLPGDELDLLRVRAGALLLQVGDQQQGGVGTDHHREQTLVGIGAKAAQVGDRDGVCDAGGLDLRRSHPVPETLKAHRARVHLTRSRMSDHEHADLTGRALRQAFLLTALILVIEVAAGYVSHSLALLSDAGHILTDVVALGLAWFAVVQARRPADARRTYGYHRVGILTAMANGAVLILIVAGISYEAARRFIHPEPVQGGVVIVAALVAIAVNSYIALRLRGRGGNENLNVRAAMLHVVGDLVASVGVVVSGLLIVFTG